jgi:hypothetical protein
MAGLAHIIFKHRELIMRTDFRQYPSKNFKQGVCMEKLQPLAPLLVDLACTGKVLQTHMEKAIDDMDRELKGAVRMLAKRSGLVYEG